MGRLWFFVFGFFGKKFGGDSLNLNFYWSIIEWEIVRKAARVQILNHDTEF